MFVKQGRRTRPFWGILAHRRSVEISKRHLLAQGSCSRPHHYYGLALDIRHDRAVFCSSLAETKKRDISTLRGADNRISQTAPLDRIEGSLSHLFSNIKQH